MAAASTAPTLLISLKLHLPSRKPNPNRILTNSRPKTWALNASSFKNGSPPETECPVPWEQQPVNEYQSLSTSFLFSWAAADIREYISRLALIGSSFAILIGLPVAAFGTGAVADPLAEALRCALGAASAGLVAMILSVLRMYLGWAYVGNRLLSATVEYEETGWYDGQIWVKTPEVLARDRLLGSFSVKPVLTRVKFTLVGLSATLAVCVFIFFNLDGFSNIRDSTVVRVIPGAYSDESARSFEPGAFLGDRDLS